MKRFLSIVLAGVLLLNVMGYYGIFLGLHYQNDRAMTRALDTEEFHGSEIITIKFPIALPYMPDQTDFERVSGKFEHQGDVYRLIKQKYAKDCLTIVCVRDVEHKKIDKVLADYVQSFADEGSNIKVGFIKDYLSLTIGISPSSAGWTANAPYNSCSKILIAEFTSSIIHPPSSC